MIDEYIKTGKETSLQASSGRMEGRSGVCPLQFFGGRRRLSFSLFFLLIMSVMFYSVRAEALTAGKIEITGLYSIGEDEFLDMFGIREGSVIDGDRVRDGIKRAFLKGLFEDISVEVPDGENPVVRINIRERDFIKKIYVSRVSEFTSPGEKDIKKIFILKEDQVMRYDLLDRAVNRLEEELYIYGFPDAAVTLEVVRTDEPRRVNLYLAVDAGRPLVVKEIKIFGPAINIKNVMKLSVGDVYNRYILDDDLKRVKEYYRKQGYFRPVVGPYSYRDGKLEITVNPGRKINIAIVGNSRISTKKLLKVIPFFELGMFNDEVIAETVDRMLSQYYSEGYPFAQIAPIIKADEKNIGISFFIFEGKKITFRNIRFKGAGLPQKNLGDFLGIKKGDPYNPHLIEEYRNALTAFYEALGYLQADVKAVDVKIDSDSNTADITMDIAGGKRTEISSLDITGADPAIKNKLFQVMGLKPGDVYNDVDISDARFRILDYYGNYGYTSIDVIVMRNIADHKASIVFNVIEGEKELFGKTIIVGNKKTRYEVIKRELIHREDQPFNFRTITEERRRLYKLGLFTDVEIEPTDSEGDKKDILVRINEARAGSVELGIGYADYEEFRCSAELSYRNLWGMNRQVILRTELSSLEQRYLVQYLEPWFLEKPLPFSVFFLHEQKKELNIDDRITRYRLKRYAVTAGVEKNINSRMKVKLYYDFSLVETFDVQPDVILSKEDEGTLAISSIKPSLVYDTRDDPFEPGSGVLAGISLKIASPLFFSESYFVKIIINGSAYRKLFRRVTLAVSARGGMAYGFGDTDDLPLVERFFLGGRSTVRGYAQDMLGPKGPDGNPTGGNAFFAGNIELRTSLTKNIGLVTFLDMGNVWAKSASLQDSDGNTADIVSSDIKYTTGIGLRYETPVGPLRVDYGFKLNREPGESKSEIHFSIGHAF